MRASVLVASVASVAVMAAPTYPDINLAAAMPGALTAVSEYFNLLARKVDATRSMSSTNYCDISKAEMPSSSVSPALPPVTAGLSLKHVAIGRGTQNYTCDTANATAVPVQVGAVATLFNATCIAATYPDLLAMLPRVVLPFNLTSNEISAFDTRLYPSNLAVSGHHFFETTTTPFFNLDTPSMELGQAPCGKNASQAAPTTSAAAASSNASDLGQQGEAAVPWLKLTTKSGATGGLQEVYRLQTAGGSAPASCKGLSSAFEVQYAAEYWFYASS